MFIFTFLLFQGGRVIMYLECRFTNTITKPNCDCVQILADAKPGVDAIPASGHANHKHLLEEFELLTANLHHTEVSAHIAKAPMHKDAILKGAPAAIFHPPIL